MSERDEVHPGGVVDRVLHFPVDGWGCARFAGHVQMSNEPVRARGAVIDADMQSSRELSRAGQEDAEVQNQNRQDRQKQRAGGDECASDGGFKPLGLTEKT